VSECCAFLRFTEGAELNRGELWDNIWAPKKNGAFPKTMAGVGHLQRIWQDACRVAGASSEMLGGPGADFRKGVAFWSIRSVGSMR